MSNLGKNIELKIFYFSFTVKQTRYRLYYIAINYYSTFASCYFLDLLIASKLCKLIIR